MMTPLPVPSQSLLQETCSAVMRTKEKPSLPVPEQGRLRSEAEREDRNTEHREGGWVVLCLCVHVMFIVHVSLKKCTYTAILKVKELCIWEPF